MRQALVATPCESHGCTIRVSASVGVHTIEPGTIDDIDDVPAGLRGLHPDNPVNLPDPGTIEEIREPTITASIIIPNDSMGDILSLIMEKRGTCDHTDTLDTAERAIRFEVHDSPTPGRTYRHSSDHGHIVPRSTVSWESA